MRICTICKGSSHLGTEQERLEQTCTNDSWSVRDDIQYPRSILNSSLQKMRIRRIWTELISTVSTSLEKMPNAGASPASLRYKTPEREATMTANKQFPGTTASVMDTDWRVHLSAKTPNDLLRALNMQRDCSARFLTNTDFENSAHTPVTIYLGRLLDFSLLCSVDVGGKTHFGFGDWKNSSLIPLGDSPSLNTGRRLLSRTEHAGDYSNSTASQPCFGRSWAHLNTLHPSDLSLPRDTGAYECWCFFDAVRQPPHYLNLISPSTSTQPINLDTRQRWQR